MWHRPSPKGVFSSDFSRGAILTVIAMAQGTGGAFATVLGCGIAHLTIFLPALATAISGNETGINVGGR
jgi:hypothetical protein